MTINISWHGVLQIVAAIVQVGNAYFNTVPDKYKPIVAGVVGIGQYILHVYAYNLTLPAQQGINKQFVPQNK